ncbi:MAG: D-glucuronyl C5-epimerase family protein [Reichenbachiella sp.]|uniref:D-glucuronyl C5-epimerase family protein n=1 Tax=Reichenbachiella sp. TaxID=2184521 RepID=UPI002966A194|nr:D-glucuronyl C5-epimerase family protein [Reichenbachiella sp.]MDW3208244.1 D-glucuronyl C5-epimerase family protein [Reichenbachiella sp.]
MSEKAFQCTLHRDEQGVTTYTGEDGAIYYSSIELAQYAMASYQAYLITEKHTWLDDSVLHIEKFVNMAQSYKESELTVLNTYPIALYKIDHPWPTSLGFGVAISLLVRLYELLKKEEYLIFAKKLAQNFFIKVDNGGVLRKINNLMIFEEYPTKELSGVLNGHIFGLWGLKDLGKYDQLYETHFNNLSINLAENLKVWNGNFWSLYDASHLVGKRKNYASAHYHLLHVKMIMVMYKLTGNAVFANFAETLIRQKFGVWSRVKALFVKVFFRLFN